VSFQIISGANESLVKVFVASKEQQKVKAPHGFGVVLLFVVL